MGSEAGMRWLRSIIGEIYGLFVDDGSFALTILVWLAVCWLLPPLIGLPLTARAPVLAIGCLVILLESAARRAGRRG
jgi:hypothetical protein